MLDGAVEMAKHAVIAGGEYFAFLRGNARAILSGNGAALERAIKRSCEIKRDIVETDEKEKRLRKSLNLGHTLGHAIEKASGYRISHGTAVGLGIIAETRIAEKLGLLGRETASEITGLMETLGIRKEALKKLDARAVVRNTLYDKKNTGKVVNYVLPAAIGKVRIGVKVPAGLVLSVLQTA
jgi:3-dehydroquinate synthase